MEGMTDPGPPQDPFAPPPADAAPQPPAPQPPPAPAPWAVPPTGGAPMPDWAHPQLQQPPYQGGWQQTPSGWQQQQPGWYQPQQWSAPGSTRKTNGLAIASLVTGVVALVPIAIGLGVAAIVQIKRRGETGIGLAIGGFIAAGVWTLLIGAFVIAGLSGAFDYERSGNLADIASTEVGSCLNDDPPLVTDCAAPHDFEVYYSAAIPEPSWPGVDDLDSAADDICYDEFEGYVGESYEDSGYDYTFFAPSRSEWSAGRHTVVCVITPEGRYLTGSVKGRSD